MFQFSLMASQSERTAQRFNQAPTCITVEKNSTASDTQG